jgi:hypothetical protein
MIDESFLRVANTPDTHFLLQAELKAIKQGLKYIEEEYDDGAKYKGYVSQDGRIEGVGIFINKDGMKILGECHLDKLHGSGKK